jgi:ligand-binding sensor domain-containing protein/signal transduction histidine kinase
MAGWLGLLAAAAVLLATASAGAMGRTDGFGPGLGDLGGYSFRVDTWKTEQGLPQNSVSVIMQTRDGYLWLGTRFGLVRFDGVSFRTFDRATSPGLAANNCIGMAEDLDGALWVLTWDHVNRYVDGKWEAFRLNDGTKGWRDWGICRSREGGAWVATSGGVFRVQRGELHRLTAAEGLAANMVYGVEEQADTGQLWVATARGMQTRDPQTGRFTLFSTAPPRLDSGWNSFCRDQAGNIWTAHFTGLCRWTQDQPPTWFSTAEGLSDEFIAFATVDASGTLWALSGDGVLHRMDQGRFVRAPLDLDLRKDRVSRVFRDREGNHWVGTEFEGLKRLQARQMGVLGTEDGLLGDNVTSIAQCRDGRLLLGVTGGLSILNEGRLTSIALAPQPGARAGDDNVTSLLEDHAGTIWVGTKYYGLNRLVNGQLTPFPLQSDLEADQVNALYEDREGRLWAGTKESLYRIEAGQVRRFTTADGLAHNNVRGILQDRQGDLWFGTYGGGICRWRGGEFKCFSTRDGLSDPFAWLLFEDHAGGLWVGTEHGLNRFKDGRLFSFTTKLGLFDDVINGLLEDDEHNFWIGCNRGIFRVAKEELDAVAEGRKASVQSFVYGTSDGMISSETNGEKQPSACRARDGLFWFPTVRGAVFFDPRRMRINPLPAPVVLEEVMVDGEPMTLAQAARLPAGRGRALEFLYTGNSLVAPEKVRYRYWLEGHDPAWINAGNRRVAIYTSLAPGHYKFHVTACNNHGLWNPTGAAYAFYLAPHFYQTPWAYVAGGLAVVLAGFGLHKLRVGVLRRIQRLEQEHALEVERRRIARDTHDELGAVLTRIGLLGERALRDLHQPTSAEGHLRKLMAAARDLFRSFDEVVWTVNPKHDTLDSWVAYSTKYAQDQLHLAGLRCRLDIPSVPLPHRLTSDERHELFLAFKEALTNVVKHAGATEVRFQIAVDGSQLRLVLQDNGNGFDGRRVNLTRNGLVNMKERVERIGGQFDIESQQPQGTLVRMRLPLRAPAPPVAPPGA